MTSSQNERKAWKAQQLRNEAAGVANARKLYALSQEDLDILAGKKKEEKKEPKIGDVVHW